MGEEENRLYALIKNFNTFMYYHTLHHEKTFLPLLFKSF